LLGFLHHQRLGVRSLQVAHFTHQADLIIASLPVTALWEYQQAQSRQTFSSLAAVEPLADFTVQAAAQVAYAFTHPKVLRQQITM
jgi:hypothetical protein